MAVQSLGGTTVVMKKFDPKSALDTIQRYGITHGQFVPAMFVRMLKMPDPVRNSYDVSTLQRVVHAAVPCPVDIKKQMIEWWDPILDEYYASSEAVGASFIRAGSGSSTPARSAALSSGFRTFSTSRARNCPPAGQAKSSTRVGIRSATSRTRPRRRLPVIHTAGWRWAKWATSTTTGSCISPVAATT
jgi:fatty-acyl-CoA synthase